MTEYNNSKYDDIRISSCCMQGQRPYQEDMFFIKKNNGISIGIFDGHGGSSVSQQARDMFMAEEPITAICIEKVFNDVAENTKLHDCGSTAVVVGIDLETEHANIGNLGDSPCLVIRVDGSIERVTVDHVPNNEKARIQSTGDFVFMGRIDKGYQSIAISRAFGDVSFSSVISDATFRTISLKDVICIVICSDGVTDGLTDDRICDIILETPRDASAATLVESAIHGKNWKGDNTTAIVVWIDPNSYSELVLKCENSAQMITTVSVVDENGCVVPPESWPLIADILTQYKKRGFKNWRIVIKDGVVDDAEYDEITFKDCVVQPHKRPGFYSTLKSNIYGEMLRTFLPEHTNDVEVISHILGMLWDESLTPIKLVPDNSDFKVSLALAVEYGVLSDTVMHQISDWLNSA